MHKKITRLEAQRRALLEELERMAEFLVSGHQHVPLTSAMIKVNKMYYAAVNQ